MYSRRLDELYMLISPKNLKVKCQMLIKKFVSMICLCFPKMSALDFFSEPSVAQPRFSALQGWSDRRSLVSRNFSSLWITTNGLRVGGARLDCFVAWILMSWLCSFDILCIYGIFVHWVETSISCAFIMPGIQYYKCSFAFIFFSWY